MANEPGERLQNVLAHTGVATAERKRTIVLYKPVGVVSTMSDCPSS